MEALVVVPNPGQARVEVTWAGQHADLPGGVAVDASDADVKAMIAEAIRHGFPGMPADPNVDLTNFVIDRYPPSETRPQALYLSRPKVPFGESALNVHLSLDDARSLLALVEDMSRYVGKMVLQDYRRFNEAPIALARAIAAAGGVR